MQFLGKRGRQERTASCLGQAPRSPEGPATQDEAVVRPGLIACVLCVMLVACSSGPSPKLSQPGGDMAPAGLGVAHVPTGQPVTVGGVVLCVSGSGKAVITQVAMSGLRGSLTVDAFAVRTKVEHHDYIGDPQRTLASIGEGFDPGGPQLVTTVCPRDLQAATWSDFVELAVQVTRTSGDVAGGTGLDITYEAGGAEGKYLVPFGIVVCASVCPDPS
jgi:hypothetical protein